MESSASVWSNVVTPRLSESHVTHRKAIDHRMGRAVRRGTGSATQYVMTPMGPFGFRSDRDYHLGQFKPTVAAINETLVQGGSKHPPDLQHTRYYKP